MVWSLGPQSHAGAVVQPKPTLLGLFLWNFKPLPSPNPFYAPAAVIQHARDHAIAVSSELFRQRDNILVNRSSSGKPHGTLRCVERCWPSMRQTLRSDTLRVCRT